jgi:Flp pilus assembly protein TadG
VRHPTRISADPSRQPPGGPGGSETGNTVAVTGRPYGTRAETHGTRAGAVLVLVMVALPALCVLTAVVIDLGHLFTVRAQLQATADAAALAAASRLPDQPAATTEALRYAAFNAGGVPGVVTAGDVTVGRWDGTQFTPGVAPVNAVRVSAHRRTSHGNSVPLFLGGFVGQRFADVSAAAIAGLAPGTGTGCIWALGTAGQPSTYALRLQNTGSAINAPSCAVYSNSSPNSLTLSSGASMTAASIDLTGSYAFSGSGTLVPNPPKTNVPPAPDPLAGLLSPPANVSAPCGTFPYGSSTAVNPGSGTTILYPGVYCGGIGVKSGAELRLQPGIYVVRGGTLGGGANMVVQNNGTKLTGSGVMFYLTCTTGPCSPTGTEKHAINFQSGAFVNLSAPTSGAYSGILFYQDPNLKGTSDSDANYFHSGASSSYDGVFYFPTQWLRFGSGSTTQAEWRVVMIAANIYVQSAAQLNFQSRPSNAPAALGGTGGVRLHD